MTETAASTTPARETLADVYIVDADVHIHEDPAALAEYAVPPWDVALREIAKVDERYLDLPGMTPRAEFRVPFPGGSNRRQIVTSAAELRAGLDDLSVNKAVLFPDHLLYLAMVREPEFAARKKQVFEAYYRSLGGCVLKLKGRDFWTFQQLRLREMGCEIDWARVAKATLREAVVEAKNPVTALRKVVAVLKRI